MALFSTHVEIDDLGRGQQRQSIHLRSIARRVDGNLVRLLNRVGPTGDPSLPVGLSLCPKDSPNACIRHTEKSGNRGLVVLSLAVDEANSPTQFWRQLGLYPAATILCVGNCLKVGWVYTCAITAEVIEFVAIWQRAIFQFVIPAVRKPLSHAPIATGILAAMPNPAPGNRVSHVPRLASCQCQVVPPDKGIPFALDVPARTISRVTNGSNLAAAAKAVTQMHASLVNRFLLGPVAAVEGNGLTGAPVAVLSIAGGKACLLAAATLTVSVWDHIGEFGRVILAHVRASILGSVHAPGCLSSAGALSWPNCSTSVLEKKGALCY